MAAEEHATSTEYIKHHLTNMTYGKMPDGSWKLAETAEEAQQMGFTAIHLDSMGWSIGLGVIFCLLFWCVAKAANSGVPTKFQSAIEMIIEFVDSSVRDTFHGKSRLIAPLSIDHFRVDFPHERNGQSQLTLFLSSSTDWCKCIWYGSSSRLFLKVVPSTDQTLP